MDKSDLVEFKWAILISLESYEVMEEEIEDFCLTGLTLPGSGPLILPRQFLTQR
nr:hypothetical protein [uncultured Desulfobacter sp.]